MSRFEDTICEAIRTMHLLTVEYGGEERLVQPYVYGEDHAGKRLLSAYQVAGGSASGAVAGWKFFRMEKVTSVALSDRRASIPRDRSSSGTTGRLRASFAKWAIERAASL